MTTYKDSIRELAELIDGLPFNKEELAPDILSRHHSLLSTLAGMDGVSIALYDLALRRYLFLRTVFRHILDLPENAPENGDLSFFQALIHEDDRSPYFDTSLQVMRFILSRPPEDRQDYRTYIDFRISRHDGSWLRLAQQNSILELDRQGLPRLVLTLVEPSPLKDCTVPLRRSVKKKSTGDFVLFPDTERLIDATLSSRELEILGLVAKGYTSPDIAGMLSLSIHTVNTHRKNILEKLQAGNASDAVRYASDNGLI